MEGGNRGKRLSIRDRDIVEKLTDRWWGVMLVGLLGLIPIVGLFITVGIVILGLGYLAMWAGASDDVYANGIISICGLLFGVWVSYGVGNLVREAVKERADEEVS